MSSFVGPRISTLGGRDGLEPCKKDLGASTGGCSCVLSCRSPSAGCVGGVSVLTSFNASGTRGADGDSVTVAGLFSHFINEDCGISRWHHGRVVVGRRMARCVEIRELTLCGDSTSPPNFEARRNTEVFGDPALTVAVAKQYHNNLQWVTADPSPSSTPSTREYCHHDRRTIGYTYRLTRAAETALCASARA
jgi:hypothetical protein